MVAGGTSSVALGLAKLVPISHRRRHPAGHRRSVLPPDAVRLPQRRRLLHRQPGEPGRVPVAGGRGVAARRLRAHRGRVHLRRRGRHRLAARLPGPGEQTGRPRPGPDHLHHRAQPAGHQGVGHGLRLPHLHLHRQPDAARRLRPHPGVLRPRAAHQVRPRRIGGPPPGRRQPGAVPAPAGLLVRRRGPDRRGGHLQRRAGLQEAEVQERGHHHGVDGPDPRRAVLRGVGAGPPPPALSEPEGDGPLPAGPGRLRRRGRSTSSCSSPPPPSSPWPPTPPTPTSPGCRRSSPATATCPATWATGATGWCSPTASSSWPSPPRCWWWPSAASPTP